MCGVLDDCDNSLKFFRGDLAGTVLVSILRHVSIYCFDIPLVEINVRLLADKVGVSSAHTLDAG